MSSFSGEFRAIVVEAEEATDGSERPSQKAQLRTLDESFFTENTGDRPDAITPSNGVTLEVDYSTLNYKDGLAITGRSGIVKRLPLIAGIDVVGTVRESADDRWAEGETVVLNGSGAGESKHGGLSECAVVSGDSLVRLPDAISQRRAAAIGTAGFTAMLSFMALERQGITPESGEILVTGAAGGVGSIAIMLLAGAGYSVTAASGRASTEGDYLRHLGATTVIDRAELAEPGRPMQSTRWAGAIDSLGGVSLANVLAQISYAGSVTTCGLASSADLPASVLPFILRGVSLLGVNSVDAPRALREEAWRRLASDLQLPMLDELSTEITLADVPDVAQALMDGTVRGRTIVNVRA